MTDKFQNKYRIPSARLKNWDYGWNAAYFVTICTQNREHYFGYIVKTRFIASQIGEIAQTYWHKIPNHFPFVILDAFVVMPNHIHCIIIINKNDDGRYNNDNATVETPNLGVSTRTTQASQKWNSASLGVIINQYKRIVTINARKIHADFGWQSRFHDHIIRNNESFDRIQSYIIENPINWDNDKFNKTENR